MNTHLILMQMCFAASLWSQVPESSSPADFPFGYVVVEGEFAHSGKISYRAGMRLSDALEAAGVYGDGSLRRPGKARFIRGNKVEVINLKRLRVDSSKNFVLQSKDIISFPMEFH